MLHVLLLLGLPSLALLLDIVRFLGSWWRDIDNFWKRLGRHVAQLMALRRGLRIACVVLAVGLIPFSLVHDDWQVIAAMAGFQVSVVLLWITPPEVLFLGVSGAKANVLLLNLARTLFPLKIVHLLRDDYRNEAREWDLKLSTLESTSRGRFGANWEAAVAEYLDICKCTIVDLRAGSEHLANELRMIARLPDQRRIIYIDSVFSSELLAEFAAEEVRRALMRLGARV